jgi:hypothetical protein
MTTETGPACPECGAQAPGEDPDCFARLGRLIAWEYDDPALYALHFYTVATYNLQHPAQFTDDALAGLEAAFRRAVDGRLDAPAVRAIVGRAFDGPRRVIRPEAERRPVPRAWPVTIADAVGEGPAGAADRVWTWAAATRAALDRPGS